MEVNQKYKQRYHANVPSGWSNDPNGMIYYNGQAHLFYQHYPFAAKWGIMHWGHFVTEDFVKWKSLPIALEPKEPYEAECGCCSGSAIEVDGKLYLMYTAAQMNLQRQCLAYSEDGVHFTKVDTNPILAPQEVSDEILPSDFRDPKVFVKDGQYYCLAGTRIIDEKDVEKRQNLPISCQQDVHVSNVVGTDEAKGYGNMVLLKGKDLYHWEYVGKLMDIQDEFPAEFFALNGVYECPDYFEVDDQEFVIASPQFLPQMSHEYENVHSCIYINGTLDFQTGHLDMKNIAEIDSGFDFYAPQTLLMPDGRRIMIAWKDMWNRTYPTESDQWIGSYTLPRELYGKEGKLIQKPVREIENYYQNEVTYEDIDLNGTLSLEGIQGSCIELKVVFDCKEALKTGLKLFKGSQHETLLYYDAQTESVVFDRSISGAEIGGIEANTSIRTCKIEKEEHLTLQCFLDMTSLEVFINDGIRTMTGNVYPDLQHDVQIEFFSEGNSTILSVEKHDIII